MGEAHDNPDHHSAQLKVLRSLHESGSKVALGLEMFRADAQGQLDRWVAGTADEAQLSAAFAKSWDSRFWALYLDLFRFARQARRPMIGLNVPRAVVSQVARKGFDSLGEEQKRGLGAVTCNVDPRYRRLMGRVLGVPDEKSRRFQHFCEAQLVWDTAMARRIADFAERNPGSVMVVLAGVFHAWRHGIPEQLSRISGVPFRVILPSADKGVLRYDIMVKDADYVWWHK
jgi:uncharacterized iron-regulated protein